MCIAVHKNEYVKVKRIVKEIDPDAFVIITGASEVLGKGFQRLDQTNKTRRISYVRTFKMEYDQA